MNAKKCKALRRVLRGCDYHIEDGLCRVSKLNRTLAHRPGSPRHDYQQLKAQMKKGR